MILFVPCKNIENITRIIYCYFYHNTTTVVGLKYIRHSFVNCGKVFSVLEHYLLKNIYENGVAQCVSIL